MTPTPSRLAGALLISVLLGAPLAAGDTPEPGSRVIDRLHAGLIEVMKGAEELGYQGRYQKLEPVLLEAFDIPFMAEKSVGRYWKNIDDLERQRLVETFARYMVGTYANRFVGYSGQHFETLGEERAPRETVLVQTRLINPEAENVQLNYRLRPVDGEWKVIDVYLNGTVSELALRRSEYSSLIKREGFPALLVALEQKIAGFSSVPADSSF